MCIGISMILYEFIMIFHLLFDFSNNAAINFMLGTNGNSF